MSLFRRPSIEEIGLKEYLEKTRSIHNDKGYEDFVRCVDADKSKFFIAKEFKVDRTTVYRWLEVYETELSK